MNISTLDALHSKLNASERGIFYEGIIKELHLKRRQRDIVLNLTGLSFMNQKFVKKLKSGIPIYLAKTKNEHDEFAISAYLDEECTQQIGWISRGGGTLFPQAESNREVYRKINQKEKFILAYPFKSGYYITKSLSNRNTLAIMNREEEILY